MNQEEKFYNYLQKLSTQTKNPLVESIIEGFKVLSGYSPIVENAEPIVENGDDVTVNTSDADDALSGTDVSSEPVVEPEAVVEAETNEKKPEETPNDETKEVIMEDVNLGERKATGDYTGTEYAKAFDSLFAFLDETEKHVQSMYRINNVDSQDQVLAQTVPHIDKILNTYKAEFQQLEEQHMDNVIPVIRTTITNAVTKWIQILKKFDIKLNQHHEIPNYYGRYVIAKFITDVVTPAINYSDMIRDQMTVKSDKLQVNVKAVMDKINTLIQTFNADVESDIKSKTGGTAYTKGGEQAQPQAVPA